ncbi:MAG: hypothetical protein ACLT4D_02650 [Blautia faecis]
MLREQAIYQAKPFSKEEEALFAGTLKEAAEADKRADEKAEEKADKSADEKAAEDNISAERMNDADNQAELLYPKTMRYQINLSLDRVIQAQNIHPLGESSLSFFRRNFWHQNPEAAIS